MSEAYSVELEESKSVLIKLDLKQFGSLKTNHTHNSFSKNDFPKPKYMMMLRKLILEQYKESRYSQEDSHVKTSQMLEKELESKGIVLHSGNITLEPFAQFCQKSCSLKMLKPLEEKDSKSSYQTFPRSGMMQNGYEKVKKWLILAKNCSKSDSKFIFLLFSFF